MGLPLVLGGNFPDPFQIRRLANLENQFFFIARRQFQDNLYRPAGVEAGADGIRQSRAGKGGRPGQISFGSKKFKGVTGIAQHRPGSADPGNAPREIAVIGVAESEHIFLPAADQVQMADLVADPQYRPHKICHRQPPATG